MIKDENTNYLINAFEKISIFQGDKILVSSSILNILLAKKNEGKIFDANLIIDLLIQRVGKSGTLMFPTYNWDFCKGNEFNYKKTLSVAGSLGNLALKRKDFLRTKNPIYSFAVTGKDKELVCNLNHESCFGLDSPFGYLIKNNGKNLFIDIDYKKGFTFCHVVEESVGVNYRYLKNFSGTYVNQSNQKSKVNYKMYVRDLTTNVIETIINEKFDDMLIKNKAYKKTVINGISLILIDIKKAYTLLVDDLKSRGNLLYTRKKNKC